jgi:NADH-quinone oxidoreductase subunit N
MEINLGLEDLLRVAPLIVLFLTSLIPITIKVLRGNKEPNALVALAVGVVGIVTSAMLMWIFAGQGQMAFAKALIFDGLAFWVGSVALIVTLGALVLAYESPATNKNLFSEYVFLLLSSALGMLVLISALDLLVVFIGLEIMSLSLYLLIAMGNEEKLSKESAFKYFLLGSFASAIMLYGVAFIYGTAGTTYVSDIIQKVPDLLTTSRLFLIGVALIIIGFCFKVSIVPFHAWTPDVYHGAPTPLSAYMATAVKLGSMAAFLRFVSIKSLGYSENLLDLVQWLAVLTMIIGNVAAIRQESVKRMLAYSSVAHSGYILVGILSSSISAQGAFAASGVVFYLISYAIMTFGAFAVVNIFETSENTQLTVDDMAGFAKRRPMLAFCLTLFLLSLAGIPPTVGFFGKFYLFSAALSEGRLWAVLWGVINSVISVYYYLRPIVLMYMHESQKEEDAERNIPATEIAIVVSMILVIGLGLASDYLFRAVENSLL